MAAMRRVIITLGCGLLLACGDDEGDARTHGDAGDAARPLPGLDAATPGAAVTNVGAACEDDDACQGAAAECARTTSGNVTFGGGYCSASCLRSDECGPEGECPLGELILNYPGSPALGGLTRGQCWAKCSQPGAQASCRPGYVCTTELPVAGGAFNFDPPRPVCLPIRSDAGAPDAGDAGFDGSIRVVPSLDAG
jgi:hypothetical protein